MPPHPTHMVVATAMGSIRMKFRFDSAPITCEYMQKCIAARLYDNSSFYRSDFVLQGGLHEVPDRPNPFGDLVLNEAHCHMQLSNTKGTAAIAHFDEPDCGGTEFFINLGNNAHLDDAFGGFCVFAEVSDSDSSAVMDSIKQEVKATGKSLEILGIYLES